MMATRFRQLSLVLLGLVICAVAFFQMFERTTGGFPQNYLWMLVFIGVLFIGTWALLLRFQPYANQTVLCCVMVLTGIGVMMIARLDQATDTSVAFRQLIWLSIALILSNMLTIFMKDYRLLRRFSYVSMVIGLVLLLSPMLPVLGSEQYGARIWVKVPGLGQFQPSEFAKLFLAFFFASYLFDHRDQLAVGGKKFLGLQLPRIQDMGPIIVVWIVSMGVLVMQHDLGTSLMFFAMFVSMLYVATGRTSWIVIGFFAFAVGAFAAANLFSHVGARVDAWLQPFASEQYNKEYGGSYQLVTGIFGLAAGGLMGTGLGQGYPSLTPIANSDYIYAALGEELGLTGLLAILMMYLLIIASGMVTAMKIKDGFGKLLASGLVFTMAFQVFTVVGGVTLVIPLTGLTLPYVAAGGSSLIANYLLAAILLVISNCANKPESEIDSDTFQIEAMKALKARERKNELIARTVSTESASQETQAMQPPVVQPQTAQQPVVQPQAVSQSAQAQSLETQAIPAPENLSSLANLAQSQFVPEPPAVPSLKTQEMPSVPPAMQTRQSTTRTGGDQEV